ncbi:MATE family efflux transporter [Planococcaceae bacterium Storch 2/2-2]|nr:MATE family efflux transporter [Planococcaceae bacterium Storch 2/2-2]
MKMTPPSTRTKLQRLFAVVFPVLITQVAMYLMTFFDIVMTGQYDTIHLAGVSVGSSFWMPIFTGLSGILVGLTPVIAQALGANDREAIRPTVQQGLYISVGLASVVFLLLFTLIPSVLNEMALEEDVRRIANDYLIGMSIGLFPLFAYSVFRSFFDALGATKMSMFIVLIAAPINIVLNAMLIYGLFGLPELGGVGAGYASGLTYWISLLIALVIAHRSSLFRPFALFQSWVAPNVRDMGTLLAIVSSHQIALNFTSFLYMMPLSISIGVTILVGQAVGAKKWDEAKSYSALAIGVALVCSILSIIGLLTFREQIASIYTKDVELARLAATFFLFAAVFQLSDAVMAPIQGALRGYKDVNATFIMAIISFWVVGLPAGWLLATKTTLGPYGYWVGLIIGLATGAITLAFRLRYVQRRVQSTDPVQQ